jgi:hypothetical protein
MTLRNHSPPIVFADDEDTDEQTLERIWSQIHERYQESCDDYFEAAVDRDADPPRRPDLRATTMHLKDVLRNIVADVLQRHTAAATEEIASAMTDEIEALARDGLADLRTQLETGDEP